LKAPEGVEPRPQRHTIGELMVIATKAFGINVLLLLGLGWIPPVAFVVPFGTGFATGWNATATLREGTLIGVIMGIWMSLLCGMGVAGLVLVSWMYPGGMKAGGELGIALVVLGLVLHLGVFAGAGAILGGHMARKEQAQQNALAQSRSAG